MAQMTVKIGTRWWLRQWMRAVLIINFLTGWRPSERTVERVVRFGVYAKAAK
jgi:hypothetical protein